jgi:hypothetical protein
MLCPMVAKSSDAVNKREAFVRVHCNAVGDALKRCAMGDYFAWQAKNAATVKGAKANPSTAASACFHRISSSSGAAPLARHEERPGHRCAGQCGTETGTQNAN